MDAKKRQYYFDGRSILLDQYDETSKFDQNFDESENLYRSESNHNFYQSGMSQKMDKTFKGNLSVEEGKVVHENRNEDNYDYDFNQGQIYPPQIIPEEKINELKAYYSKKKGYMEHNPQTLMNFIYEFRTFHKKGLKLPDKIKPFLTEYEADLEYSLVYYFNQINEAKEKMRKSFSITNTTSKKKFTEETLKRLYPGAQKRPSTAFSSACSMKTAYSTSSEHLAKFAERLISSYYIANKRYSNQENELFEFWTKLSNEEKEKKNLIWEKGENNLYAELIGFFSEDAIAERLYELFQNICGYKTYDTRPLHDYWVSLKLQDKYLKGLNKLNDGELYMLLDEKKQAKKEEILQKQNEELEKKRKEEELRQKPKRDVYERLLKKLNSLAQAKDKWKTGKNMIQLRNKFRYDNIIDKMIQQEFSENKEFRYPEQYSLYDAEHERKVIFKNSIEKDVRRAENIEKIKEMIQKAKFSDDDLKKTQAFLKQQIENENLAFEKCLKKHCIFYYKNMKERTLYNKRFIKEKFLSELYGFCLKNHKNVCKRLFGLRAQGAKGGYGAKRKSRYNNFPNAFKTLFYTLFRTLSKSAEGKFVFGSKANLPFWAPALRNNCKIHKDSACPLYCRNNTFNKLIGAQKDKGNQIFFNPNTELTEAERLNLWKRKDLLEQKQKIFLCLSEAEHCTFEPKLNKKENEYLENEELIKKRVSNKEWVEQMGPNFTASFPLVFKEGTFKKARIAFLDGNFTEAFKKLQNAFDIDAIKAHFDPKFALVYKKKLEEERRKQNSGKREMVSMYDNEQNAKKNVQPDDYKNGKNRELCYQVFCMVSEMENYKKAKEKEAKKIEEELKIINRFKNDKSLVLGETGKTLGNSLVGHNNTINNKNLSLNANNNNNTAINNLDKNATNNLDATGKANLSTNYQTLHKENYLKDRYFKFFKSIMCPLKNECIHDVRPRWPHTNTKTSVPFGMKCPYAHYVSELKFEQEIKEKIRLKQCHLKELKKNNDPMIINEWIPTGPIISCIGCGKTFNENRGKSGLRKGADGGPKGLCGFCRFNQKNEIENKHERDEAQKKNKNILKEMNFESKKPEEWDTEYEQKFGILKKANILFSFRRYPDALKVIAEAVQKIDAEQKSKDEKFQDLDRKWRAKLQISDYIIPKDILNYNITQEVLDHFEVKIPISTLLVYVEKMRKGSAFSMYNRHTYLNNQIKLFHDLVTRTINKYKVDLKNLKRQLNDLNLWQEKKEKLQFENKKLYDKYASSFKNQLCPNIKSGKKCEQTYRKCKYAHSAIQLNLTKVETNKKLIQNNIKETKGKIIHTKTPVAWNYPKEKVYEKGRNFDKLLIERNSDFKKLKRCKSEKRSESVDISKMRIKCHEI